MACGGRVVLVPALSHSMQHTSSPPLGVIFSMVMGLESPPDNSWVLGHMHKPEKDPRLQNMDLDGLYLIPLAYRLVRGQSFWPGALRTTLSH